jgi:hypothetical protein
MSESYEAEATALATDLISDSDLVAAVRAHIRVEHALFELVDALLKAPEHRKDLGLDYFHTVDLALALGLDKRLGPPLKTLGTLRNNFAHKLDTTLDTNAVASLYQTLGTKEKEQVQKTGHGLWVDHNSTTPYPKFKGLSPRDQFVGITIVLWGTLRASLLNHQQGNQPA